MKRALPSLFLLSAVASAQALGPPVVGGGEDWGAILVDWTQNMVTSFGGLFVNDAITELAYIFVLMLIWLLIRWGFGRFSLIFHRHEFPFGEYFLLFIKAGFLLYLLNHYVVPFPGVSFSFHSWPMAVAKHMTLQLDNGPGSAKEQLLSLLQSPTSLVDKPLNPVALLDNTVYGAVIGLMGLLSFGMFILGGLGYVLSGVMTVWGPYFIPLWLVGGRIAGLAWGWQFIMLALASYRVLGSLLEYVIANVWIFYLTNILAGNTSAANWIAHGSVCVMLSLFTLLAMTMIPLLAAQVFNGAGSVAQAGTAAVEGAANTAIRLLK